MDCHGRELLCLLVVMQMLHLCTLEMVQAMNWHLGARSSHNAVCKRKTWGLLWSRFVRHIHLFFRLIHISSFIYLFACLYLIDLLHVYIIYCHYIYSLWVRCPSNPYCKLKNTLWPVGGALERRRTSFAGTTMKLSELTWPYTQWQGWPVNARDEFEDFGCHDSSVYFVTPAIPCFAY